MTYTKQALRKAVFAVFEDHCNLDNYEFVALLEMFDELREMAVQPKDIQKADRIRLIGVLDFLATAQHITPDQCDTLAKLVESIE
jgi:hypothetical protein